MPRVQHGHAVIGQSVAGTVSLPAAPATGNVLILAAWARSGDVSMGLPAGFTLLEYVDTSPSFFLASWLIAWRRVQAGDPAGWTSPNPVPGSPARMLYLAEWSNLDDPADSSSALLPLGTYTSPQSIAPAGSTGDLIFALFGDHADYPDRLPHISGSTTLEFEDWMDGSGFGPYGTVGTIEYPGPATADYPVAAYTYHDGAKLAVVFPQGASAPPGDPGYTPPPPAKAILEIYVHDESASRWGEATWATGPATGTEGIWSVAGWTDVTPQGVTAHVTWGARRADRGILADQDAATWNVQTYDPDRKLDPGNPDSPYAPELLPGLPIRVSHGSTVVRTGYADEISYSLARPDYQGQIIASDTIAMLAQADVPSDSILGDTLLERINDAIVASGVAVGGLAINPKMGDPGGPSGASGPALSARPTGTRSVWDIVRLATREVLYVPYITRTGELRVRAWGAPLDRGRELADPILIDMTSRVTEDGLVSVVQVKDATGASTIERVAAPLPRYGRRLLTRSDTTIDPESWADAILADRAWPGVLWVPGTIRPRDAADVDYLATLEVMERVTLTVAGVVSIQGRILGGELWVSHRENDTAGAKWAFRFAVATDGSTAVGSTTLVADGTGDTLIDDATGTDYLEAD